MANDSRYLLQGRGVDGKRMEAFWDEQNSIPLLGWLKQSCIYLSKLKILNVILDVN